MIAVLSESQGTANYIVSFHEEEGLPAYSRHEFNSVERALECFSLNWQDPDDDADGDVIKVASA